MHVLGAARAAGFDVWLFTHDADYAASAVTAGVDGVVVDWEWRGKEFRQLGRNTEINHGTEDDLRAMRSAVKGRLACRINNLPRVRVREAMIAAELGADEVWLPMVRTIAEVEECLRALPGGCRLGVLAETPEALALAPEFNRLALVRVYLGLNDLWITSGRPQLFSALVDGAVERFRSQYRGVFGFGGITRPSCGSPVPCQLLLAEMVRLGCGFGVARRSFRRDAPREHLPAAVDEIKVAARALASRTPAAVADDRRKLEGWVERLGEQDPGVVNHDVA